MGSEVLDPILTGLKWGAIAFFCLGLIYIAIFRFRNSSAICRMILRAILYAFAAMLSVPSAICAFAVPLWIFAALFGEIEPPSDRLLFLGVAILLGGIMAGAWWGLTALFRHFNRSIDTQTVP